MQGKVGHLQGRRLEWHLDNGQTYMMALLLHFISGRDVAGVQGNSHGDIESENGVKCKNCSYMLHSYYLAMYSEAGGCS